MNKRFQIALHIIADLTGASLAWFLFFLYRKHVVEAVKHGYDIPINNDLKLIAGLILIPAMWLVIYAGSGYYKNIFRRSRLRELEMTLLRMTVWVITGIITALCWFISLCTPVSPCC